jgi:hypothetical protein
MGPYWNGAYWNRGSLGYCMIVPRERRLPEDLAGIVRHWEERMMRWSRCTLCGSAYAAAVFVVGFCLGTLRVLLECPGNVSNERLGDGATCKCELDYA